MQEATPQIDHFWYGAFLDSLWSSPVKIVWLAIVESNHGLGASPPQTLIESAIKCLFYEKIDVVHEDNRGKLRFMENDYFIELNLLLFWNGRCIFPVLYKLRHVYLSVNYKYKC